MTCRPHSFSTLLSSPKLKYLISHVNTMCPAGIPTPTCAVYLSSTAAQLYRMYSQAQIILYIAPFAAPPACLIGCAIGGVGLERLLCSMMRSCIPSHGQVQNFSSSWTTAAKKLCCPTKNNGSENSITWNASFCALGFHDG